MRLSRVRFNTGVPVAGFVVSAVDTTARVSLCTSTTGVEITWESQVVLVPWSNVLWATADAEPATPPGRTKGAK
jgi:hypothetical protein